jgi:hypothetical protein
VGRYFNFGLVRRLVVILGTGLEEQRLVDDVVVCIIVGQIPVVDQAVPDGAGGPPVVR